MCVVREMALAPPSMTYKANLVCIVRRHTVVFDALNVYLQMPIPSEAFQKFTIETLGQWMTVNCTSLVLIWFI